MENKINENKKNKKFELSFKLNNNEVFPNEAIEGTITLKSNPEILDSNILDNTNISFSLIQKIFIKFEDFNFFTNQPETKMENKSYILNSQTINYEHLKGYGIEYGLEIPFQISFSSAQKEDAKNFYPSFKFISPKISCFIIHKLSIEIPENSNKFSKIIFMKKMPNETLEKKNNNNKEDLDAHIFKEHIVKKLKIFNVGKLNYFIKTKKKIQYNEDIIPLEIHLDENDLKNIKVQNINISLRKILTLKKSPKSYKDKIFEKKISLLNEKKNKIIKENIQLDKDEFPKLPIKEIEKSIKEIKTELETIEDNENLVKDKMKLNFTPPIDTEFFKFEYLVEIVFDLDSNLVEEKKLLIPIDFYDGDFNKLKIIEKKNSDEDSLKINENNNNNDNNLENINIINENSINEMDLSNDIDSGFTIITKEDFIDVIDGKK